MLQLILKIILGLFILLSISRTLSLYLNYHSPLEIYTTLSNNELANQNQPTQVCIGKEWYRFPSHFFFPSNNVSLQFLRSDFRGQLPKYYEQTENATWIIPTDFNDLNLEEMSRYVNLFFFFFFSL